MQFNEELLIDLNKQYGVSSYAGEMGTAEMNEMTGNWINKTTGKTLSEIMDIKTTTDTLLEIFVFFSMLLTLIILYVRF